MVTHGRKLGRGPLWPSWRSLPRHCSSACPVMLTMRYTWKMKRKMVPTTEMSWTKRLHVKVTVPPAEQGHVCHAVLTQVPPVCTSPPLPPPQRESSAFFRVKHRQLTWIDSLLVEGKIR
jgi:hypothetical protein